MSSPAVGELEEGFLFRAGVQRVSDSKSQLSDSTGGFGKGCGKSPPVGPGAWEPEAVWQDLLCH